MSEPRLVGRDGLGEDQRKWLDRIEMAGGLVRMDIEVQPVLYIEVGTEERRRQVRVPIRQFESLQRRLLFEEVHVDGHPYYRLKDEYHLYGHLVEDGLGGSSSLPGDVQHPLLPGAGTPGSGEGG